MNILVVSDPHGFDDAFKSIEKKAKKSELVLIAGDLTIFERNLCKILDRLNRIKKPVLIIPGNHESPANLRRESNKRKHLVYLDGRAYETKHVLIFACEGDGFSTHDPGFKKCARPFISVLKEKRKANPKLKFLLMTHAPPYNTKLDHIYGEHVGNKSVREFIEKYQPDIAVSGHLHETFERRSKLKKTIIMNPGPYGKIVRL